MRILLGSLRLRRVACGFSPPGASQASNPTLEALVFAARLITTLRINPVF